jgi:orotate phosphoribosyltransferase
MPDATRQIFEESGAFLRGHFVYTSGRHGADYLEKFRLLENPRATQSLGGLIARHFARLRPQAVAGPTMGGLVLAYEVARQLGTNAVYAERGDQGGRVLRRGFRLQPDERVLVVDDVVTTGASLQQMIDCVRNAGGTVVGVGVLADRTAGSMRLEVPFFACISPDFPSYAPQSCPLCAEGIPLALPRGSKPLAVGGP